MKLNKEQLESIASIISETCRNNHASICQEIWDYVEGELTKKYPLPERSFVVGDFTGKYKCRSCGVEKGEYIWHQEITGNVTQLTCPECGAIHSEMIKGDG